MSETWMELLNRVGVFNVEMCCACKKRVGTHQWYSQLPNGERVPSSKRCDDCHHRMKYGRRSK